MKTKKHLPNSHLVRVRMSLRHRRLVTTLLVRKEKKTDKNKKDPTQVVSINDS